MKRKVTVYRNIDLDETGVVVGALPKSIAYLNASNTHATLIRYLKIYDKATAATNADTPVLTIPLTPIALGGNPPIDLNGYDVDFDNGISLRATTGVADNDTGAPGNNEVVVNLGYMDNLNHTL